MQQVHGFACAGIARSGRAPPELKRIQSSHATALKPPHKAGRRGGESIARQRLHFSSKSCDKLRIIGIALTLNFSFNKLTFCNRMRK
ncbi:hypothetical protein FPS06_27260 [Escherichia coli]|nr:hypothetical protein [Escherichia coli]